MAAAPAAAPAAAVPAATGRAATGPAVNLLVEVRVVDEAQASGHGDYTVSTRALATPPVEALQLQLLNGQTGAVRLGRALPVQWLQRAARGAAVASASAAPPAPYALSADRAGAVSDAVSDAVTYAVTWVPSGQSLTVRPQWVGGSSPVNLTLQFSSSTLRAAPGTALPATRTRLAGTTLHVPLGVWTAFAATGTPLETADPGSLSTLALAERGRQLMQVRVTLP